MGITLLTLSSMMAPLQAALGWLLNATPQSAHGHHLPRPSAGSVARPLCPAQPGQREVWSAHRKVPNRSQLNPGSAAARPLRVLRVVDVTDQPCHAGRMVISGRMADVCAELDRLAAQEALHRH